MKIPGQAYYAPEEGGDASGGTAGASGSEGGGQTDWRAGLNEDLRGYVENKGWSDPSAVAESYRNLEKLRGVPEDRLLKLPDPEADPSEWNAVWEKLGRPSDPNDYTIPMPEGQDDTSFADWARGTFHELGMPAGMAEKLVGQWNEFVGQVQEGQESQYRDTIAQEESLLRKDWGRAYEQNIGKAKLAADRLGVDGETIDALENAMGYSKVMKLFNDIGSKMGESEFHGNRGGGFNGVMSPDQARSKLAELQANPAWVKKFAEGDVEARAEKSRLVKLGYPDE